MTPEQEIKSIVHEIHCHDFLYWKKHDPLITDIDYDNLKRRLAYLNPNHPILDEQHSPEVNSEGKVKHSFKRRGLDKVYTYQELIKHLIKIGCTDTTEILTEPKYDGWSIVIENGYMFTKGDGEFGDNISSKLPVIMVETEGRLIDSSEIINMEGEVLIKKSSFAENNYGYKNTRNAISGILNKETIDLTQKGFLTLVDYKQWSDVMLLKDITPEWVSDKVDSVMNSNYPTDGLVFKVKDPIFRIKVGSNETFNLWEIALKHVNAKTTTTLNGINWSSGKRCKTPVGLLDPVDLSGITISNVSLHNYKNILDRGIHIGDILTIERAGDVIPYCSGVTSGKTRFEIAIPTCGCGEKCVYEEPDIVCPDKNCLESLIIMVYDSIRRIGINELGKPTVEKMVRQLGVRNLAHIFYLTPSDIIQMDGFAETSASNLWEEIQRVKNNEVHDYQILSSLNIEGLGDTLMKTILERFTISDIYGYLNEGLFEGIPGWGPERKALFLSGMKENESLVHHLIHLLKVRDSKNMTDDKLELETVCFTEKMEFPRSYYEKFATENGFTPVGSVTKDLTYLVSGNLESTKGKTKKAKQLGINIISLGEFMLLIGQRKNGG